MPHDLSRRAQSPPARRPPVRAVTTAETGTANIATARQAEGPVGGVRFLAALRRGSDAVADGWSEMTIVDTRPPVVADLLGTAPADLALPAGRQATPDEARARADRIRTGLASYVSMRQDIADAFAMEDWRPLGYPSWHAYVTLEFGQALAELARDDRREAVRDLRSQGMSTRQIASAVGADAKTVRNDLAQVGTSSPAEVKPEPAKITGSDGKSYPATKPKPEPDPRAEVAEAIEKHLPPDPDEKFRPWRASYLRSVVRAADLLALQTPEEVAERGDDDCIEGFFRHVRAVNDYAERLTKLLAERDAAKVTPLRRVQ